MELLFYCSLLLLAFVCSVVVAYEFIKTIKLRRDFQKKFGNNDDTENFLWYRLLNDRFLSLFNDHFSFKRFG